MATSRSATAPFQRPELDEQRTWRNCGGRSPRALEVGYEVELVSRIERDERGRGYPDTFETYEPKGGKALLKQRDVDLNGDGEMDIISVYRNGKLVRREIADPDL